MVKKIITSPRIIFVVVFGYVSANLSARFAYTQSRADLIDYFMGGGMAIISLAIGIGLGYSFAKAQENNKQMNTEIMGIILATLIEIGVNALLIFSNV